MTVTFSTTDDRTIGGLIPASAMSAMLPAAVGVFVMTVVWSAADTLAPEAKMVIAVALFAVIGWIATPLPDSLVALLAALALVVTGAQPQEALTETLGQKIVWLLLAAFVIAAVLKDSGLADRLVAPLTRGAPRVLPFMFVTAAAISVTAFLLPSTSGRAALLLPVYVGVLAALPDKRLARPVALLFPTAILLSAGGSLIGAGAHVVAVEAIGAFAGPQLGYLEWLIIGAPLAFASVGAATLLIFALFVPQDLRQARLVPVCSDSALCPRQRRILIVLAGLVALWMTKPWHGLDEAIVALAGAVLLLLPPFNTRRPKDVFRSVDMELILYMAATLMLSVAVIDTGVDHWLAAGALAALPNAVAANTSAMVLALSVLAVGSHLAITSRSARAAILVPALALPVAGMGHDATLAILIAVMGTGFCQTMMVSAKPVAMFGMHEQAGFTQRDLFRLALPLAPIKIALLTGFALWVWPEQLEQWPAARLVATPMAALERGEDTTAQPGAALLAVSLRPVARPDTKEPTPSIAPRSRAQGSSQKQHRPLVAQIQRDARRVGNEVQRAGRNIERQMSRLFR